MWCMLQEPVVGGREITTDCLSDKCSISHTNVNLLMRILCACVGFASFSFTPQNQVQVILCTLLVPSG